MAFDNQRKFGRVTITSEIDEFVAKKKLGMDALEIDFPNFKEALEKKKGTIKSALMDQQVIAGIGNIYSDEILFQNGIHPKRKSGELEDKTLKELHSNMKRILETAIEKQANPKQFPKTYLLHNRVKGANCPKRGGKIETVKISGRTTYICPNCQKQREQ